MAGVDGLDDHIFEQAIGDCLSLIAFFGPRPHHNDHHKILLNNTRKLLTCMYDAFISLELSPTQILTYTDGLKIITPLLQELHSINQSTTHLPPGPGSYHSVSQLVIRLEDNLSRITNLSKPCTRALRLPIACTIENPRLRQKLDGISWRLPSNELSFLASGRVDSTALLPFRARRTGALNKYTLGTASRYLESKEVIDWISGTGNKILWLLGPEGTGKTVLASVLVDALELKLVSSAIGITYAFLQPPEGHPTKDILQQLIIQLLDRVSPDVYSEIQPEFTKLNPPEYRLRAIFKQLILSFTKVYLIIDAMDTSCDGYGLLSTDSFLFDCIDMPVQILLTSRHLPESGPLCSASSVKLQPDQDSLSAVIEGEIERKPHLHQLCQVTPGLKHNVRKKLVEGANGSFTLPLINIDYLSAQSTAIEISDALLTLPETIDMACKQLAERILKDQPSSRQRLARCAMTWLFYSCRDLTDDELALGIAALRLGTREQEFRISSDFSASALADATCGIAEFVEVHHGKIESEKQSHAIARLAYHASQLLFRARAQELVPDGHTHAARACLQYILIVYSTQTIPDAVTNAKFLPYAIQYWYEHASKGNELDLKREIRLFLSNSNLLRWTLAIWCHCWSPSLSDQIWQKQPISHPDRVSLITPLAFAIAFGLPKTIERMLQAGADPLAIISIAQTPLQWAAACENPAVIVLLLSADTPLDLDVRDQKGRTPLYIAAEKGLYANVDRLIEADSPINIPDVRGKSILNLAAARGDWLLASVMLRHDAIVDQRNYDGRTALHEACRNGYVNVAKILMLAPHNLEARDKDRSTPLHLACWSGLVKPVSFLISRGANLEARDNHSKTPLMIAIYTPTVDRLAIIKLLVHAGASTAATDSEGRCAADLAREAADMSRLSPELLNGILNVLQPQAS